MAKVPVTRWVGPPMLFLIRKANVRTLMSSVSLIISFKIFKD
jgi:hypothetical protein